MFEVEFRVASINHPNWADKSVPFTYRGLKEARFGRVIAQSRSDFSHDVVDVWFGIDKKIGAPKFRHNVPARNQLFSATNYENHQFHGLLLGLHPSSVAAKVAAPDG
jgi:hypothetical protein